MNETRTQQYRKNLSKNSLLKDVTDCLFARPFSIKEIWGDQGESAEEQGEKATAGMTRGEYEKVYQSVGYGVLAPTLHRYVIWVLKQAMDHGIKRLYFLARDAYFMYLTACIYVKRYRLDIDCRYLYCSRYAIRVPNYHRNLEKALDYITLGGLDITPEKIYARAGITGKEREILLEERLIDHDQDEQIPRGELPQIRQYLKDSSLFMDTLKRVSKETEPAFEGYLKQEGLLDEIPMALVDSGWVGSLQKDLNETLQRLGKQNYVEGYYFGLYEVPDRRELSWYHTYHFSPEKEIWKKVQFNNCIFESIFTAPHGMTLGYTIYWEDVEQSPQYQHEHIKKYKPRIDSISQSRLRELDVTERIILTWQDALLAEQLGNCFKNLCRKLLTKEIGLAIDRNLSLFMHHPTTEEAKTYGELVFSDDILEYGGNKIATELSSLELKDNRLMRRLTAELIHHRHVKQSGWYEGSAVLYSTGDVQNPKKNIRGYSWYKYLMYIRKKSLWQQKNNET